MLRKPRVVMREKFIILDNYLLCSIEVMKKGYWIDLDLFEVKF